MAEVTPIPINEWTRIHVGLTGQNGLANNRDRPQYSMAYVVFMDSTDQYIESFKFYMWDENSLNNNTLLAFRPSDKNPGDPGRYIERLSGGGGTPIDRTMAELTTMKAANPGLLSPGYVYNVTDRGIQLIASGLKTFYPQYYTYNETLWTSTITDTDRMGVKSLVGTTHKFGLASAINTYDALAGFDKYGRLQRLNQDLTQVIKAYPQRTITATGAQSVNITTSIFLGEGAREYIKECIPVPTNAAAQAAIANGWRVEGIGTNSVTVYFTNCPTANSVFLFNTL